MVIFTSEISRSTTHRDSHIKQSGIETITKNYLSKFQQKYISFNHILTGRIHICIQHFFRLYELIFLVLHILQFSLQ